MIDDPYKLPPNEFSGSEVGDIMGPIKIREWARLKKKLRRLRRSHRVPANLGSGLIGVGVSGFFAWVPYVSSNTAGEPWGVAMLLIGGVGVGTGAVALVYAHLRKKDAAQSVGDAIEHMDDMEVGFSDAQRELIDSLLEKP